MRLALGSSTHRYRQSTMKEVAWILAISLLMVMLPQVSSLSFKSGQESSKERYYKHLVASRVHGRHYDGTEVQEKTCEDQLKLCSTYQRFCDFFRIVREACPATCGMCRLPFPSSCQSSPFGCCWDNITIAKGPNQEGCPACVDIHQDCKVLAPQCPLKAEIRRVCPVTCGALCRFCEDDPYQKEICPFYRKAGFCSVDPVLMAKHCRRTCKFC